MGVVQESLAGRYELLEVVGRGGMGVVYRARDRVLSRLVAVKLLPSERADDPVWVARLEREARSAAALSHPHIVSVFDTGCDGSTHFIVMEYVEGRNLAQVVGSGRRISPTRAARLASQIASALGAAHEAGVVHRDIKPTNVMVDRAGSVRVLDFGIARAADSTTLTQTAVILGSAPYLAPEVARGEPADPRADIYSLGCVLYELLTGGPPFTADVPVAILHQHNTRRPRPPRELNPEVTPALQALVLRMLAKDPGARPQNARHLARDLDSSLQPPDSATTLRNTLRSSVLTTRSALGMAAVALIVGLLVALLASAGGSPRRGAAQRPRASTITHHQTSTTRPHSASSTPATPTHTSTKHIHRSHPAPLTVAQAAGALTSLVTQDLQTGAIDQHGQDILNHLQDILSSNEQGHSSDALHKLGDLLKHLGDLSQHGDIQPSAVAPIYTAVNRLRAALLRSGGVPSPS